MVAPKGGRFQSRTGNCDLKMLFMRLNLFTSSLLRSSMKAWPNLSRLVYLSPSISCYLWFSYIRFVFMMFSRLDALDSPLKIKVLGFIRLILASHICSTDSIPSVRTWGTKGPLTTTEDLSACKSTWTLIRIYTVNKPLFWRCCRGTSDQDSIFYCFLCNFQFSFGFSFCIY
jgi:hypothetical protein